MAIHPHMPGRFREPFPDWQLSLVVTLLFTALVLSALVYVRSLPQESGPPRSEAAQQFWSNQANSTVGVGGGPTTLGQR